MIEVLYIPYSFTLKKLIFYLNRIIVEVNKNKNNIPVTLKIKFNNTIYKLYILNITINLYSNTKIKVLNDLILTF